MDSQFLRLCYVCDTEGLACSSTFCNSCKAVFESDALSTAVSNVKFVNLLQALAHSLTDGYLLCVLSARKSDIMTPSKNLKCSFVVVPGKFSTATHGLANGSSPTDKVVQLICSSDSKEGTSEGLFRFDNGNCKIKYDMLAPRLMPTDTLSCNIKNQTTAYLTTSACLLAYNTRNIVL